MNFKHTFHVFVDNFSIVYKRLLYGLIVLGIGIGLFCAILIPAMNDIMGTAQYADLHDSVNKLLVAISNLETEFLHDDLLAFRAALKDFVKMFGTEKAELFTLCIVLLTVAYLVYRFLMGLGNYTTGALISDRMTLQANSPFFVTMIKNLRKASIYNAIYVPVSFIYDVLSTMFIWALFFRWLRVLPLLVKIFLFATLLIGLVAIKLTFTVNWLPALIHGKASNGKAFVTTFKKSIHGFWHVFSTYLVMVLIILALNVSAIFFTFGAGLLITIPASYVMLISFQFVSYYNSNKLKFFIGSGSVVGPKKETPITIEEFFKGEEQ